ncbi:pyridoxal phosphate-dependent transferase [Sporodiniella umbellata]|nr:pyridoxal phosphate-dependent transferase [Sporodiniella umbellata]
MSVTLKTGEKLQMNQELFERCLSYDYSSGLPHLVEWLKTLQKLEHNNSLDNYAISIGQGSQDVITKALETIIDPGDTVLLEEPSYTGIISYLQAQPCEAVGIMTDEEGIMPKVLDDVLNTWSSHPFNKGNGKKPKALYTIPCGGNPTGASASLQRKKDVYAICQKHDLLIFEDDPYYYLQFKSPRVPSYLSIDTDGRVIRFDSMSKVLSSGLRIGWVTGPKMLVEKIDLHTMVTNIHASGISQLMVYELLNHWGYDKFFEHVETVSGFYSQKADQFIECLEKRMRGYSEWVTPTGGMFVWMKLLGGVKDSEELVLKKAIPNKKVLVIPGIAFTTAGDKSPYIRASFSNATYDQMDEGLRRLAEVIQEEADINGVKIYK